MRDKILAAAALASVLATGAAWSFTVPNFKGTDPTIASPGYPDFWATDFSGSLRCTASCSNSSQSVWTLSISGSDPNIGIFNFPNGAYLVGNEQVKLTANFNSTGTLLTSLANTYEIDGSLAPSSSPTFGSTPSNVSWTSQPIEKLFSTSLTAVTVDSKDEALGFKSTDFGGWANQKQFTGGSTTESVWLYSLFSPRHSSDRDEEDEGEHRGHRKHHDGFEPGFSDWDSFVAEIKNHTLLKSKTFFGLSSIATVPLPAAALLFASGLAGLGYFRRRRASAATPAASAAAA